MNRRLLPMVFLVMLGVIASVITFPGAGSAAAAPNALEAAQPTLNVEKWRTQDISFTSSLTTQLLAGNQSTFESASVPPGWGTFGGGTVSASTTVAHGGSSSLKLANRSQSYYSPQLNVYSTLKAGGPGKYNFSFWVYVDSLNTSPSSGRLLIRGNTPGQYSFLTAGQSYGTVSGTISTPASSWTKYSGSVNVDAGDLANETGSMQLMIDTMPGMAGQNLYLDDVQITKNYYLLPFDDVSMDVTFTGPDNSTIVMPAFWDGGDTWKVRFAPNQIGIWNYSTTSSNTADLGLHHQTGTINCVPYTGSLAIYQKGFVKTEPNTRYFVYDDGTPFFYLGDTHWSMPQEPYTDMFKPLVDDRVSKGFTVYQSEPLGAGYNLADGVSESDVERFRNIDSRFAYIADAGLVHTNSELFFANEYKNAAAYSTEYKQKLTRYWMARYSAYPVLWTTAQESDKNLYGTYDTTTNPWKVVFNAIHQYDPYQHPLTVHQENTSTTKASDSAFKDLAGYSWFGVQWAPRKNGQLDFNVPKDYWNNGGGRPSPNYEGHYENLWTNDFGARMQGWSAYLNGMYGHGYGTQDIWLYNSTYDEALDSNIFGITITTAMKNLTWQTSKDLATSTQLGTYMKTFFSSINWWQLIPRFDNSDWFANNGSYYSVASADNDTYVAYFYNATANTGTLKNMDNVPYSAKWFSPLTGAYTDIGTVTPCGGEWTIPAKPDTNDWTLLVMKAPVTTVTTTPGAPEGSNGWYVSPTTVALSASGNQTGIAKTEYSLDGGATWQSYSNPLTFNQDGSITLSYRSTDKSGNVEAAKSIDLNVDRTAPTITVSGLAYQTYDDSTDITAAVAISDNLSGVDDSKTAVAIHSDGVQRTVQPGATIPLYTLPLGAHTLTATASDTAGNPRTQTVVFETMASNQSLLALVGRFAGAGWIDNDGVANSLRSELNANNLRAFVNHVNAQRGRHISIDAAGYLLRDAQFILNRG